MQIRRLDPADLSWVASTLTPHFGSTRVVTRGAVHDATELPGFIAQDGTDRIGLLQYRLEDDECEVVTLISLRPRQGVARLLLESIESAAAEHGCRRLWLITTNNNYQAIQFYRSVGWREVAVHKGAIAESRKLKPELPLVDDKGMPIEDEIEFELKLRGA
jgi:ribosomal protein S18 acetylase RimI-like enzyme